MAKCPGPSVADVSYAAHVKARRSAVIFGTLALTALVVSSAFSRSGPARVASVYDGDTLTLTSGEKVRLLQIDTPELGSGECYSRKAATALRRLAPLGVAVTLVSDPVSDDRDRYGRLLRYVFVGGRNVNLELVRAGAAAPYFYRGERGRYAAALTAAARAAKGSRSGLWGACPATRLDPEHAVTTGLSGPPARTGTAAPAPFAGSSAKCDRVSYPTVCIPPAPPDLDCRDVRFTNFVVRQPDPHRFDGNRDGVGCEK